KDHQQLYVPSGVWIRHSLCESAAGWVANVKSTPLAGEGVMIVDSQVHLWAPETPERPWIAGGQQRAHLPEALTYQRVLPMMDEAGVDRAIVVPPTWPGDDNDHA